jgi:hypothetical protein
VSLALAILVVAGFLEVARRARLPQRATEAGVRARASLTVLRDPHLGDDAKERRLREESVRLFELFLRIVLGGALALGIPLAVVWALDAMGIASVAGTVQVLARLDFLLAATAIGAVGFWLSLRRERR